MMATASPWAWEPRPDVWLLVASLVGGYWWSLTRLRLVLPDAPPMPSAAVRARFMSGVAVLWLAVDWPLDRIGDEFLFSAHMTQFVVIALIAAPLLVAGVPVWLQRELVRPVSPTVRFLARAPIALLIFQLVLVATHLPVVVSQYSSNEFVHFVLHLVWVLSALLFWLPILGSEPVVTPLGSGGKFLYLIAATIAPTVPASFLTWAETPLYDSYAEAPRIWGLSAVDDLQLAGAIMKVGGGTILWGFILWVFVSWAASERVRPDHRSQRGGDGPA